MLETNQASVQDDGATPPFGSGEVQPAASPFDWRNAIWFEKL
jgi:hypothetical protein